jgi:hypothetical protein
MIKYQSKKEEKLKKIRDERERQTNHRRTTRVLSVDMAKVDREEVFKSWN